MPIYFTHFTRDHVLVVAVLLFVMIIVLSPVKKRS